MKIKIEIDVEIDPLLLANIAEKNKIAFCWAIF